MPTHKLLDAALEQQKGDKKIGSTLKGIGPVYQDKIGRHGIRIGDLKMPNFKERYNTVLASHKAMLSYLNFDVPADVDKEFLEAIEYIKKLKLVRSEYMINEYIASGKKILAEGAQGTLLDIDFGSYPFVTSSNTSTAGACTGLGVSPTKVDDVIGIFKAYCTRVGSGPFPTELFDKTGETLREVGGEYGATTGRERRCGWLDLPALKYSVMINGITKLYMMKVDVLEGFDEIKICTNYKLDTGEVTDQMPFDINDLDITPEYETFEAWGKINPNVEDLPDSLKKYIAFIEKYVGVGVELISYGPERSETKIF